MIGCVARIGLGLLVAAAVAVCAQTQRTAGIAHAERALVLMRSGRNADALREWEAALRLEPNRAAYRNFYGLALRATGKVVEAQREFRHAVVLEPNFAEAHSNLAYSLSAAGEEREAAEEFDRALKLRPFDASLHTARGLLAANQGNAADACRHFERAVPWPADARSMWTVFATCLAAERVQSALRAASNLPSDAETQLDVGLAFLRGRRPGEAIRFLAASRKLAHSSNEAGFALAEAYVETARPAEALQTLDEMPEADRQSFAALELRGLALLNLGRRDEAANQFRTLVKLYPDIPEAYIHATQVPLEEKRWDEALSIIDGGLERIPGHWLLLFRRGVTYKLSGHLIRARADLVEAVRNGGDIGLVMAALGMVHEGLTDFSAAADVFQRAFRESGRAEFQAAYALALQRQGDDTGALREMKKAVETLPENARIHYEYGKLLRNADQLLAAKAEFEKVRQLDPKLAANLYALSRVYGDLGQQELARKILREFSELKRSRE